MGSTYDTKVSVLHFILFFIFEKGQCTWINIHTSVNAVSWMAIFSSAVRSPDDNGHPRMNKLYNNSIIQKPFLGIKLEIK